MVPVEALGERLSALRLCEASAVARMQRSLSSVGQLFSIAVFPAEKGQIEVVDGFKRLRAARALGWSELRAHALAVDAAGAKVALSLLHDRHGLTEIEEAWLVRSLYREDHLSQPEIARRPTRAGCAGGCWWPRRSPRRCRPTCGSGFRGSPVPRARGDEPARQRSHTVIPRRSPRPRG